MTEELKEKLLKNVGEKARNVFLEKQEKDRQERVEIDELLKEVDQNDYSIIIQEIAKQILLKYINDPAEKVFHFDGTIEYSAKLKYPNELTVGKQNLQIFIIQVVKVIQILLCIFQ